MSHTRKKKPTVLLSKCLHFLDDKKILVYVNCYLSLQLNMAVVLPLRSELFVKNLLWKQGTGFNSVDNRTTT